MSEARSQPDPALAVESSPRESVRLVTLDPRSDERWQHLVRSRASDVFHSSRWLRTISSTYDLEVKAAVVMVGSTPIAGMPYAVVDGLTGVRIVVFPFSDYCDPLVSSFDEWQLVTSGLFEEGLPIVLRCLHNPIPTADEAFTLTKQAHWHAVDLESDQDELWEGLAPAARRAIRRSSRAGVEVAAAETPAELRAFYELHLGVRKRKYRMLAQPFLFFQNLWHEFVEQDRGRLMLARVGGRPIAGVFFLEWKDRLYYKLNASDPDFSGTRPNDAIMWAGIEYGRERGHQRLDLGLSDWGQEGLLRYKRKYATEEQVIRHLTSAPPPTTGGEPGGLAEIMPTITELLTDPRVPNEITERGGEALYRFFA